MKIRVENVAPCLDGDGEIVGFTATVNCGYIFTKTRELFSNANLVNWYDQNDINFRYKSENYDDPLYIAVNSLLELDKLKDRQLEGCKNK